jgi:taurine dioxygenase
MKIIPNDAVLGATVTGLDLSRPMTDAEFGGVLAALGRHGVLRFPDQHLESTDVRAFSARFGELQGSISRRDSGDPCPEVGILSNKRKAGGGYIGTPDAGQGWHTDMSYRDVMGFVNVLYGITIPRRDGRALGGTEFANMHAAYDDLPGALKTRLADATAVHDFEKFWEMMRREKGSQRPAMTAEQKAMRPPVVHPLFLTHPLTGRKVLYCNPGYAVRINGMEQKESDETLATLFAHQLQPKYRYTHVWTENDVLIWDHLGTIHQAIADYRPDEVRLIKRCQVMATRVFTPEFRALAAAA